MNLLEQYIDKKFENRDYYRLDYLLELINDEIVGYIMSNDNYDIYEVGHNNETYVRRVNEE